MHLLVIPKYGTKCTVRTLKLHSNLNGVVYHLLLSDLVRPANPSTITGAVHYHRNGEDPCLEWPSPSFWPNSFGETMFEVVVYGMALTKFRKF
jgi:hypothetical protein